MAKDDHLTNWAKLEPKKAAQRINTMVEQHEKHLGWRHAMALRGALAYSGAGLGDLFEGLTPNDAPWGGNRRKGRRRHGGWRNETQEQHARASAEALSEKITGLREPKTQMVATDAEYELKRQGVWADRFVEGNMHLKQGMFRDTWDLARHGFLLAAVSPGVVAVRVEPDYVSKRVRTQLRSTLNTFIDPGDVACGQPLTYIDVTWENPEYLIEDERFAGKADMIWKASKVPPHLQSGRYDGPAFGTHMVKMVSAWRMPFGSFKGREAVFFGNDWALWEKWEFPEPPLAFFRMNRCLDPQNFWGENFIEIMLDPLRDAEDIDDLIQRTMSRTSQTNINLDGTTTGPPGVLNALDVNVFKYDSSKGEKPPGIDKPGLLHSDYFNYRDRKIEIARQLSGLPEMHIASATGAPNASGKSKRLEASLLPERFAKRVRGFDNWVAVDIATLQIRAARAIGKVDPDWQVTWPGADFDSKVSVEVLDIDDHIYELRPYVVNEQKNTPAALAQDAQEAFDRGDIDKASLSIILNGLYDTKKETKRSDAERRFVAKVVDDMLHADEDVIADEATYMTERYMPPPTWLEPGAAMAQAYPIYLNAMIDGVPQNRRNLIRRFLEEVMALKAANDRAAMGAQANVSVEASPEQIGLAPPAGAPGMAPPPPDVGIGAPMPGPEAMPPGMGAATPGLGGMVS